MTKVAAIYARVSSDRQKENHTIASQLAASMEYAEPHGYKIPAEWRFQDKGYSGATLLRPGLEAVRVLAAAGHIEAVLIYSPDRLSRKYAYQVLLAEELSRCGVELVFLQAHSGTTPEDQLLVQFQGMIAEYERAQMGILMIRGVVLNENSPAAAIVKGKAMKEVQIGGSIEARGLPVVEAGTPAVDSDQDLHALGFAGDGNLGRMADRAPGSVQGGVLPETGSVCKKERPVLGPSFS
jgi:hypothetical protein